MHRKKWVINVNRNIASQISPQTPTLLQTCLHSNKQNIDTETLLRTYNKTENVQINKYSFVPKRPQRLFSMCVISYSIQWFSFLSLIKTDLLYTISHLREHFQERQYLNSRHDISS